MSRISRRTLLRATSAAPVGLAVVEGTNTALGAPPRPATARAATLHEEIVRDARMIWRWLPEDRHSAPLLGGGTLVAQVHRGEHAGEIDIVLSRPSAAGPSGARLVLCLAGTVTAVDWTLDLWNAQLTGTLTTTRGSAAFTALIPAGRPVLLVELAPSAGESAAHWRSASPGGAADATPVWRERRTDGRRLLVATLATGGGDGVVPEVDAAAVAGAHRAWWHAYYRRSLVSVPDKRTQRFYWAQLYTAAALDGDAGVRAAHPFLQAAGHGRIDAGAAWTPPVGRIVIPGTGMRSAGVGNPVQVWRLPELWAAYRRWMDPVLLRERVYPALVRALSRYEPFLVEGATGRLHLPVTYAHGYGDVADCTYDLSLLRWASARAAEAAVLLDRPADGARWRRLSTRLAPYHRDDTGVMVGSGVPFGRSQAAPAHLLWLYPLREASSDRSADRQLMRRSYRHWAGMREAWRGRSHATASSMAAALGAADEAHAHLREMLHPTGSAGDGITPNARYAEAGRTLDAGAFAAAGALQDMLIRGGDRPGTGTVLEIFPAVPAGWSDVSVAGLRAEGALLVDASRAGGRTEWVRVHSERGGELVVRHGIDGPVDVRADDGGAVAAPSSGAGQVTLRLRAGESVVLARGGAAGAQVVARNVASRGEAPRWGLPAAAPAGLSA